MVKCSSCSIEVRPIVAVDIDGTLGQYHDHFTRFASKYVARQLPDSYPGGCEFSDYLGLEKEEYREIKLAYRQGGMKRSMPTYWDAEKFMGNLQTLGAEIWITTTRPYLRLDNLDPDTRFWLQRHDVRFDHLLYHEDKYTVLADSVDFERVVAIVDDLQEQLIAAEGIYGHSVLMQPERVHNINDGHPGAMRFGGNFTQAFFNIKEKVKQWNLKYQAQ